MKILIDTNVYLDFYRSGKESIKILTRIIEHSESFILTDQIINEFQRNRVKVIKGVKKVLEKEISLDNISSSFLDSFTEFKRFIEIHSDYKSGKGKLLAKINEVINDISKDPVYGEFKLFVDKKYNNDSILGTNILLINRAQRRKFMGNPPSSDKFSLGDEINWEIILENIKEDLIIVGRDKTYNENFEYLRNEFHKNTGCYIHKLTEMISDSLKILGSSSDELEKIELKQVNDLKTYSDYWKY